jgi:hypothetical protein
MCIKLNKPDRATLSRFLSFLMRCFYAIYAGQPAIYAICAIAQSSCFYAICVGGAGLTRFARFTRVCFLVRVENRPLGDAPARAETGQICTNSG